MVEVEFHHRLESYASEHLLAEEDASQNQIAECSGVSWCRFKGERW